MSSETPGIRKFHPLNRVCAGRGEQERERSCLCGRQLRHGFCWRQESPQPPQQQSCKDQRCPALVLHGFREGISFLKITRVRTQNPNLLGPNVLALRLCKLLGTVAIVQWETADSGRKKQPHLLSDPAPFLPQPTPSLLLVPSADLPLPPSPLLWEELVFLTVSRGLLAQDTTSSISTPWSQERVEQEEAGHKEQPESDVIWERAYLLPLRSISGTFQNLSKWSQSPRMNMQDLNLWGVFHSQTATASSPGK